MEEKSKRGLKEWFTSSQVLLGMILVQVFVTGLQLLSRVILVHGSFIFSLIAYRHIVAAICVAPFALYFERGRTKNFTPKVWFWLFVNALMGTFNEPQLAAIQWATMHTAAGLNE